MITGSQIRMARGHLKWSIRQLAEASGVGESTVKRMEETDGVPNSRGGNLLAVQKALEAAGIKFVPENGGGAGVRLAALTKSG